MADYLLRIGKHRWPIVGVWPCPPFVSDHGRTWRGLLEFKQFRLYLEYSENDNPHMFAGKGMEGVKNPGNVLAIDPPNRVEFTNVGALTVRMALQQMADHPLNADEIALLGPIYNSIEEVSNTAKRPKRNDSRPRWGEDQRRMYDAKIHELIMEGKSNRDIANMIPAWAENNPGLRQCRVPGNTSLQKWAAVERKKNQDKRRKRMK